MKGIFVEIGCAVLFLIVSLAVPLLIYAAVMYVAMFVYREPPGVGIGMDELAYVQGALLSTV